jgi:hypothetical protein
MIKTVLLKSVCSLLHSVIYSLAELLNSSLTHLWNTFLAVIPCYNSHADALEHSNTITRCVTIITISFVVLISTTYYQTLLLSNSLLTEPPVPPLSMQDIVPTGLCWSCNLFRKTKPNKMRSVERLMPHVTNL